MNNAVYGKTLKNVRNRIDVRLVSNKRNYLKWLSKRRYLFQKIFNNDLVDMYKSNVTLKLKKLAYVGMCKLDLSKVLMYVLYYDYIKNKYGNKSRFLYTDIDSLIYEIKTKYVYEKFSKDKEMFDFSNYSDKSKYYDDSKKLVVDEMKDKKGGVAIKKFIESGPKMYLFLIDDGIKNKKANGVSKNVVEKLARSENRNVWLNSKCLRHSANRILKEILK